MNEEAAIKAVVASGRVYLNQGKYLAIKVFTLEETVAKDLKEVFRGEYYSQGKGFIWALGYRKDIVRMAEMIRPHRKVFDKLDPLYDVIDKKPPS